MSAKELFGLFDFSSLGEIAVCPLNWVDKVESKELCKISRNDEHLVKWADKKSKDHGKKYVAKILAVSGSKVALQQIAKEVEEEGEKAIDRLPLYLSPSTSTSQDVESVSNKRRKIVKHPYIGSDQSSDAEDELVAGSSKPSVRNQRSKIMRKKLASADHQLAIMKELFDEQTNETRWPDQTNKKGMPTTLTAGTSTGRSPSPTASSAAIRTVALSRESGTSTSAATQNNCSCCCAGELAELKNSVQLLESTVRELLVPRIVDLTTEIATLKKTSSVQLPSTSTRNRETVVKNTAPPVTSITVETAGEQNDYAVLEMSPSPMQTCSVEEGMTFTYEFEDPQPQESTAAEPTVQPTTAAPADERPVSPTIPKESFCRVAATACSTTVSRFVGEVMQGVFTDSYFRTHCRGGNAVGSRRAMRTEYLEFIHELATAKVKPQPTKSQINQAITTKFNNRKK